MRIEQKAIENCITALALDLSRYFRVNAKIDNVGDKRFWETNLKDLPKQYTESSNEIQIDFAGNVQVDNGSSTAPTRINYSLIGEDSKVMSISVKAKRRQLNIPINCRINVDNFIEVMSKTEELIDKAVKTRVFTYTIFGTMHKAQYRIQYDSEAENKSNIDYSNDGNGFNVDFSLNLEMHYYAIIHKSFENTNFIKKEVTQLINVDTGDLDENNEPIITQIPQSSIIYIQEDADILNQSDDIILNTLHRLKIVQE